MNQTLLTGPTDPAHLHILENLSVLMFVFLHLCVNMASVTVHYSNVNINRPWWEKYFWYWMKAARVSLCPLSWWICEIKSWNKQYIFCFCEFHSLCSLPRTLQLDYTVFPYKWNPQKNKHIMYRLRCNHYRRYLQKKVFIHEFNSKS